MLDYKDIIIKHYALKMSGSAIAKLLGCSKSGVNDFLRAFKNCESLSYPLPEGITNYGIVELVYGKMPGAGSRDQTYELPDFEAVHKSMVTRKNMILVYLWNRYVKRCEKDGLRFYQYRQFCELYSKWCNNNAETLHIDAVIDRLQPLFAAADGPVGHVAAGKDKAQAVPVFLLPVKRHTHHKLLVHDLRGKGWGCQ